MKTFGKVIGFTLLVILILVACYQIFFRLGEYVASQQLVPSSSAPDLGLFQQENLLPKAAGPENTEVAESNYCITVEEFAQAWNSTKADAQPGTLMEMLNTYWDQREPAEVAKGGEDHCRASSVGMWKAPPGSILWTDRLNQPVVAVEGDLKSGDFVDLKCQGTWCVSAVYAWVWVPTPGRSANLEKFLDPSKDLSGWSNNPIIAPTGSITTTE